MGTPTYFLTPNIFHQLCDLYDPKPFLHFQNPPPSFHEVSDAVLQADRVAHLRNEVQMRHEEEYRDALVTIQDNLRLMEGPDIKENLQDQIRHWFIECR